ncbi:nucleotide sugar dehydrogenase [Mycobacterium parmense]|uniref:UDP-N-acetyl-D-mannosaminuronic acid dehydrogenase n=1 Tax=Mycobacterium parmense TaxID=185642 RepID=A0A7I7YRM9_9MYCO|nr:nucleotide sugar dehydrogenase [Mycobacterium parmense]MCV7348968.1 nucleotide sugar dehydrogenase [Mycobacterium parmense]ORW56874.1 nucleotide sugar dehydrogenase [Mycobacterium parmense]BBZ44485.1 UDP-N-acetyl-D-mannosaminuronic acid dehydrogenase [Mycobacterium parmense]
MAKGVFGSSDAEIDLLVRGKRSGIAVVGFGYIGTVIGAVLADRGWPVTGIDVRQSVVDEINLGKSTVPEPGLGELVANSVRVGRLRATTDFGAVAENDFVIVTVGTPLGPNFEPIVDDIKAAARAVGEHLHPGHLVILKSTVPPDTTEKLVCPILEEVSGLRVGVDFGLAFCPERLAEGQAIRELTSIPVVVGAVDERSARACSTLWRHALGVESVVVDDPRTAEMVKLADNLWVDLNVALANELAKVCDRLDMDALQVIEAANTMPKGGRDANILRPSMGVGGYCLTKDPWFVNHLGETVGLELAIPRTSRTVNDTMPAYTYGLLEQLLAGQGKAIETSRIAVLGIAFKNNTGDCRLTPTKYVLALLEESGCQLAVHDPWVPDEEAHSVTKIPLTPDIESAVKDADALVVLAGHRQFHQIPLVRLADLTAAGCVFLDGRNSFDPAAVRAAGFVYKGIGR